MFDWERRSTLQKFALVMTIFTLCVIVVCLISNIVCTQKAADESWFVRCNDCKRDSKSSSSKCTKCCSKCSRKDGIIFYAMRGFSMLFCLLAIVAEFPQLTYFRMLMAVFKYYWGRGLLQIFLGFLTLTGNLAPDDSDAASAVAALGWIAIGCGVLHLFLSCLCFKEYSEVSKDREMAKASPTSPLGAPHSKQQQQQDMSVISGSQGGHSPATGYAV
jgi:hypothetical protein